MSLTYMFRFLKDDGSTPDHYGIAQVKNMTDLFWEIDNYGDPTSCEIVKLNGASICFKTSLTEEEDVGLSELELGDSIWSNILGMPNVKFKAPPWSNYGG